MNRTRWMAAPPAALVIGFALAFLPVLAGTSHAAEPAPPPAKLRITTEAGDVQGQSDASVTSFKGLPYAAPPVGELRWRAPQPAVPWQDIRAAQVRGNSCLQKPALSIDSDGGDPRPMGEDCLTLNVWTPRTGTAARLPVMVWIHGGALIFGAGGLPVYDGAALAQRGAVVVTLNYRLGALGFFAHPAIAPPGSASPVNFGLLDQVAALQWVQRNIAAFGGDAGNVTIFGQSAGAESVLALLTSPLAKSLFHKAIAQSPYGIPSHTLTKARETAVRVASALNLSGASASAAELRSVPAEAFEALSGNDLSLTSVFIVGDAALPQPILSVFQQGREANVPLIIGNTSDDGSIAVSIGMDPAAIIKRLGAARIAVKSLYPKVSSDEQLGRETVRDLAFTAFARRIAYLHSARAPTWRYYYSYVPAGLRARQTGVPHGGEVALTMGTLDLCQCLGAPVTAADRAASARVSQHWFDFARSGTPVPQNADAWPRDARRSAKLLEFGATDAVRTDFMKPRLNAFIGTLNVLGLFTGTR